MSEIWVNQLAIVKSFVLEQKSLPISVESHESVPVAVERALCLGDKILVLRTRLCFSSCVTWDWPPLNFTLIYNTKVIIFFPTYVKFL